MKETLFSSLLRSLPSLFPIVLQAAMLIVAVYCIRKRPTPPAYVMLVGLVLEIPGALFVAWWNFIGVNLNLSSYEVARYFNIEITVSNIGALIFACGFLLFIHDALRKRVSI